MLRPMVANLVFPRFIKCVHDPPFKRRLRHEVASVAVETTKGGLNPVFCHRYPTGACGRSNLAVREPSGQCSLALWGGCHIARDDSDC